MTITGSKLSKRQKKFHISTCILALESSKGHLAWKITDLVRKANVSRTLVYRYFGSTKKEMLVNALHAFTNSFYGFDKEEQKIGFAKKIKGARSLMLSNYEAILFYQKWRMSHSFLKDEFITIEKKFQKKLKLLWPDFSDQKILTAYVCIHGIVTSPFLDANEAEAICNDLIKKNVLGS